MPKPRDTSSAPHVGIIGAGIGGLAAAARLSHAGLRVTVLERHSGPGGKMRVIDSVAGPVDAGPTVLTMKPVFDALFADLGERIEDHLTLTPETVLARHFWSDGAQLDLMADRAESTANIRDVFGKKAAAQFERFAKRAAALFDAFDTPMMQAARPSQLELTRRVLRQPSLIAAMAPHRSLATALNAQFSEPKLAQLFGRYATYVGGRPEASPAILSLIADAEARGVWCVKGGMHQLARALERLAKARGASFHFGQDVTKIKQASDGGFDVTSGSGSDRFDRILFNGDPRALRKGLSPQAVTDTQTEPRSLSAYVHSFAATPSDVPLAGHNVFFGETPEGEFGPLAKGAMPHDPTLYICAQDRFAGHRPTGPERFEIIMNGPPAADGARATEEEKSTCQTLILARLARFGLRFGPTPQLETLTTPAEFGQLFPATNGSLYGRSPHGLMAAFKRPTALTAIPGLYLVGGGAHPGAGVPMATISAKHAAEAILNDLTSTSTSRRAATHGGISMASATTARVPSQSSVS
ncbi:MAG: 1-hydroxycarotenoid 3,4-desaturase CrtD [Pseudomonadota bacterium]